MALYCDESNLLYVKVTEEELIASTESGCVVNVRLKDKQAAKLLSRALPAIRYALCAGFGAQDSFKHTKGWNCFRFRKQLS
jgi:hypothetical protein